MTTTLTNEEKLNILTQHLRSLDYSIYGAELDIIEAEAVSSPNSSDITAMNEKLTELNAKRTALLAEEAELSA
jgi:hypothetical protein